MILCNMHCVSSFSSESYRSFVFMFFILTLKPPECLLLPFFPRESCSLLTRRAGVNALDVSLAPDDPNEAPLTDGQLYELFRKARQLGALVRVHCENGPVIRAVLYDSLFSALLSLFICTIAVRLFECECLCSTGSVPKSCSKKAFPASRAICSRDPQRHALRSHCVSALPAICFYICIRNVHVSYVSFRHSHFNHLCV